MLSESEQLVRMDIQESDAPFLGLLGESLTPEIRQAIHIAVTAMPSVNGYIRYLEMYPALFAVNLTWHVMKGMGQGGHFDVYPHICTALNLNRGLLPYETDRLWRAFRAAVQKLGLVPSSVMSSHYMVNEYLRQAGVPLAFADDLAEKMLSFANKVGLPDTDDPEDIANWQTALDVRLNPPFSATARKAVATDSDGYYTRVFLRVHHAGGQVSDSSNALDRAMARAFQRQSTSTAFKRAALPYVMFFDGTLGIFFPGGEEREFVVMVDDVTRQYRTGVEDRFSPLTESLPHEVVIRDTIGRQSSRTVLWEDDRPNRLLLFSESGRLKGHGQLAQREPLVMPPGGYMVLSRVSPSEIDTEKLWEEPQLYTFPLVLHPGEAVRLTNGPARLVIQGESQPFLQWQGENKTTKDGVEFFYRDLQLVAEFPQEWLAIAGRDYILRVSCTRLGSEIDIPVSLDDSGRVAVDMAVHLKRKDWKPGLTRLLAELRRPQETRILIRGAVLYWHELLAISPGPCFVCNALPSNLERLLSENVAEAGNTLKPANTVSRTVRLVFNLGENRRQSLIWNVPGVFIEVESFGPRAGTTRVNRPLGSIEVVSYTSTKQIVISGSDPGRLSLGDWSQPIDFSRRSSKSFPAAFLASRITSQSSTLVYRSDATGLDLDLLKLLQPHNVRRVATQVHAGQFVVHLILAQDLEALAVQALEIVRGVEVEITLKANTSEWEIHRFGRARLMVLGGEDGGYEAYAYFHLASWPSGAWVFRFDGCVRGVWGHLENERQDVFGASLLLGDDGRVMQSRNFLAGLECLDAKESLDVLGRVQNALLPCYAVDTWERLQWLKDAWRNLVARWRGREVEAITRFVDLAIASPSQDAAPSWMLQQVLGATLPHLFALPPAVYRKVNEKPHSLPRALRAMGDVADLFPLLFPTPVHVSAAAGFSNFSAVARGASPRGFDVERYSKALREMDASENPYRLEDDSFLPGPSDYLGPLHYRHAMRSLEAGYDRSLGGNEIRRGQAIGLCHYVRRVLPRFNRGGGPDILVGQDVRVVPWLYEDDDALEPEVAQRRENLSDIAHLMSWLAFSCRLETRARGTLDAFLDNLRRDDTALEECLGYALQVGHAIFAYYLLLWELVLTAEEKGCQG